MRSTLFQENKYDKSMYESNKNKMSHIFKEKHLQPVRDEHVVVRLTHVTKPMKQHKHKLME